MTAFAFVICQAREIRHTQLLSGLDSNNEWRKPSSLEVDCVSPSDRWKNDF